MFYLKHNTLKIMLVLLRNIQCKVRERTVCTVKRHIVAEQHGCEGEGQSVRTD